MISFMILTISDRSARGERPDLSGPALRDAVVASGWEVIDYQIVPDDVELIQSTLTRMAGRANCNIILTTGGTGFSPRDVTPEATLGVIDRQTPGLVEAMRQASLKISPHAMLSRAIAGIREKVLIINLPGSPKAAIENFQVIQPVLQHAVDLITEQPSSEAGHTFKP
jgi:molybdenum cofactor synthesis domain-containing protein